MVTSVVCFHVETEIVVVVSVRLASKLRLWSFEVDAKYCFSRGFRFKNTNTQLGILSSIRDVIILLRSLRYSRSGSKYVGTTTKEKYSVFKEDLNENTRRDTIPPHISPTSTTGSLNYLCLHSYSTYRKYVMFYCGANVLKNNTTIIPDFDKFALFPIRTRVSIFKIFFKYLMRIILFRVLIIKFEVRGKINCTHLKQYILKNNFWNSL